MNIKITHNWLLEYLNTDANPFEIQKYLSLCGPSVEHLEKIKDDYIYEIEVTSNRVDSASVMGIAREAAAILPRFGINALFRNKKDKKLSLPLNNFSLVVEDKQKLSARIMAAIFDQVKIKDSPEYIINRLEAVGIRALNNLVDITNYVMVETGHPAHVFDYDRVKTGKFIIRTAKSGEKLITLDKKTFELKGGEIIFDDGTGKIVDLPSIMGTENSVITEKSQRVIFFIDNIDPIRVRKASMTHGIRTQAAAYNEKNIDPELVLTAFHRGTELFEELAHPRSVSKQLDIYPSPTKIKQLKIDLKFIHSRIGKQISDQDIITILKNLQFKIVLSKNILTVIPPSSRSRDIQIPEDIVEEVARIYGYHNLSNNIQPTVYVKQPKSMDLLYELQSKVKYFLKHLGLNEVMNYSMISKELILNNDLKPENHLKLKNTISEEIEYMRTYLMPSLIKNIKINEGKKESLRLFEIAKTYKKTEKDLPLEEYKLGIVTNSDYFDIKGIVEAVLRELNISQYSIVKDEHHLLSTQFQLKYTINNDFLVEFGELKSSFKLKNQLKSNVYLAVFDFKTLIKYYRPLAQYKPVNHFAVIKLDQTFENKTYEDVKKQAFKSKLLQKIELVSVFKNKFSLRFYFSAYDRNITEEEAKKELKQ